METTKLEEVISQVLQGQVGAYDEIVRRYQVEVWKAVAGILRDRKTTEDLVQETFVNAYRQLDRVDARLNFGACLRTIARNLAREELRSRSREAARLMVYGDLLARRLDDDARDQEMEAALGECRKGLTETCRRLLELRYGQALTFEQIGAELGRTADAARQNLARIRVALRECVHKRMVEA